MTTCDKCGQPHFGTMRWCDQCLQRYPPTQQPPPQPHTWCSFCGTTQHRTVSCPIMTATAFFNTYANPATQSNMRRPRKLHYQYQPPLKTCPACKGNYLIETKAGSVCSSCRSVVHNPCRNCDSVNTKGKSGDGMQFIECTDCLFIE